jgi:hypothetical protein
MLSCARGGTAMPTAAMITFPKGYGERRKPWIVEGEVRRTRTSADLAKRLANTSNTKYAEYGFINDPAAYAEVLGLFPRRVLAWSSFPSDAARFEFGDE